MFLTSLNYVCLVPKLERRACNEIRKTWIYLSLFKWHVRSWIWLWVGKSEILFITFMKQPFLRVDWNMLHHQHGSQFGVLSSFVTAFVSKSSPDHFYGRRNCLLSLINAGCVSRFPHISVTNHHQAQCYLKVSSFKVSPYMVCPRQKLSKEEAHIRSTKHYQKNKLWRNRIWRMCCALPCAAECWPNILCCKGSSGWLSTTY